MPKKPSPPKPDADGFLRTGIYQRYVGPQRYSSADEIEELMEDWCEGLNAPAEEDISELRQWLRAILAPHIDGPFSDAEARTPATTYYALDFGNGIKIYRAKPSLTEQARNAIDALNAIRIAEIHLAEDGKRDWLYRAAFKIGMLYERIQIRPYEPLVGIGKRQRDATPKRRQAAEKTNEKRRKEAAARVQRVGELVGAGVGKSGAVEQTASEFDVEPDTIWRNLKGVTRNR